MASIRTGSIVTDIRGSVATETYSRNAGGLYIRERVTPTYPNTAAQQACKATLAALAAAWSGTLTETQRTAWHKYGAQHPRLNKWGIPTISSGYLHFIRCGFMRHRLDGTFPFLGPPPTPPLHQPQFTATYSAAGNTVTLALPPTTYTLPSAKLELFAYIGIERAPGVTYYSSPFRYLARNLRNGTWSTDPWTVAYPNTLHVGERLWCRLVAQHSLTGEISEPTFYNTTVGA